MTSKIVVNNIESDAGINSVTFNSNIQIGSGTTIHSSGIDLGSGNITGGIVTATSFTGSGTNLTSLPAANLTGTLPAISGANLTGINTAFGSGTSVNTSGIITATAFVPTVGQLSHRNIIINGAMSVAQRGTSNTAGGDGYFTVDRMYYYNAGIDNDVTKAQADVASGTSPYTAGFRKSFKLTNGNQTTPGTGDEILIRQNIEAQDIANSGWNYTSTSSFITLSYWVKSSVAQNFYVNLQSIDGTSQNYVTETGSLTANTWTKIVKTIPGNSNLQFDNDNAKGMFIQWNVFRGTSVTGTRPLNAWAAYSSSTRVPDMTSTWWISTGATFEITGVQLEVGPQATAFEHRSYGDELQRCMRYYEKQSVNDDNGGYATVCMGHRSNSTTVIIMPVFRVIKRAPNATFEFNGPMRLAYVTSNHVAITSWSSMSNSQFSVQGGYKVVAQASGVGGSAGEHFRLEGNGDTGAYISFESEL